MMNITEQSFILNAESIDNISAYLESLLTKSKCSHKDILRIRLMSEDLLLRVVGSSEQPINCRFSSRKRFGTEVICLEYDGHPFNPLEEDDEYTNLLFKNLGIPCKWKYLNQNNLLTLQVEKRKSNTTLILLAAIIAACVLGFIAQWVPESIKAVASENVFIPFKNAYLGLLGALAGILIFFNILSGLCGDKDSEPLGKRSKRMFLRMPLMLTAITAAGYALLTLFFHITFAASAPGTPSQAGKLADLLWKLIPDNFVSAFSEGNYIHILIFAFLFGTILSKLRDYYPELVTCINGINRVITEATIKVCRLIPAFVFCCLLYLFISSDAKKAIIDLWKPIVFFLAVSVMIIAVTFIGASLRTHTNLAKLLKAVIPSMLICLTTASPIAAYSTNINLLENNFGFSKRFSRVGLSVSSKIYGPGCVLYIAVMVMYFAEKYTIPVNFGWLLIAVIMTVLLTFACPPVPGGLLIIFGIIAKQFGFPDECMILLATVDVILDGLSGAVSCILRNAELLLEANSYGELNTQALKNL